MRQRDALVIGAAILGGALFIFKDEAEDFAVQAGDWFTDYDPMFHAASAQYGVPWRWIKAVAWNESSIGTAPSVAYGILFPDAEDESKSSDGKSWGIMQVTLSTARGLDPDVTVSRLNNPAYSILLGTKYLAQLIKRFGISDRESVIRAYNGGPGFRNTVAGQRDTPIYYDRFVSHLNQILDRQPGNEREIG